MVDRYNSVFLLFSFISLTSTAPTHGSVRNCSNDELEVSMNTCSDDVNDLLELSDQYNSGINYFENVSLACQSVITCYGGLQCLQAEKLQEFYKLKCEKLNFKNNEIDKCISKFYEIVYQGSDNCTNGLNYFSKDMRIKRDAYTLGKSFFLQIAKKNCSAVANSYLNSNYETILNILTVSPEDGECNSLHDELMAKQCEPQIKSLYEKAIRSKMMPSIEEVNSAKTCESIKNCMRDYCYYTPSITQKLDEVCQAVANITNEPKDFDECYVFISMHLDSTKYDCTHFNPFNSTSPIGSILSAAKSMEFLDDKSCVKTVMMGECGESALKTFDKDWEKTQTEQAAFEFFFKLRKQLDLNLNN